MLPMLLQKPPFKHGAEAHGSVDSKNKLLPENKMPIKFGAYVNRQDCFYTLK